MNQTVTSSTVGFTFARTDIMGSVKSIAASRHFIQGACRVVLLNTLYHRLHIDEAEFVEEKYENVPYKMFRRKSTNPVIRQYHAWVTGILESIEKNYLKHVILHFKTDKGEIVETYKMTLSYCKNDEAKKRSGKEQVEATKQLLNNLKDMGKCPKLKCDVYPTLQLEYIDEVPPNYEPANFGPTGIKHSDNFVFENSTLMASINTGYHRLRVRGTGQIVTDLKTVRSGKPTGSIIDLSQVEEDPLPIVQVQESDNGVLENTENAKFLTISDKTLEPEKVAGEPELDCICKLSVPAEQFVCVKCKKKMHLACNGFLMNFKRRSSYVCISCDMSVDDLNCILPTVEKCTLALTRLVLASMHKKRVFPKELLNLVEEEYQVKVIAKFKSLGMIVENENNGFDVVVSAVNYRLDNFFVDYYDSQFLK